MDYDDAYANAPYIPNGAAYLQRWEEAAAHFRQREVAIGRARVNQPYGGRAREAFDLFLPAGRPDGLLIFVHGGYWRMLDRRDFSHLAEGAQAQGWAVALPSYDLCPEVRIGQITGQIARAVKVIAETVPGPVALAGHSAGGHLVARMAMEDVDLGPVRARIRRFVPISPLSDLRPLMKTSMQEDFQLTAAEAEAQSPALRGMAVGSNVHIWVGGAERPAFLDQARWLQAAWGCEMTVEAARHHYDVIEGLDGGDLLNTCLAP